MVPLQSVALLLFLVYSLLPEIMTSQHLKIIVYAIVLLIVAALAACWPQIQQSFTGMMIQRAVEHVDVVQKAYVAYWSDHKSRNVTQITMPSLEQLTDGNYLDSKTVSEVHQLFPEIKYL